MQRIGRKEEQRELQRYAESRRPELLVAYGRRRVGKTYLIRQFFNEQFAFYATGIAKVNKAAQLKGFNATLRRHGGKGTRRTGSTPSDSFENCSRATPSCVTSRRERWWCSSMRCRGLTHPARIFSWPSNSSGAAGHRRARISSWWRAGPPHLGSSDICSKITADCMTG